MADEREAWLTIALAKKGGGKTFRTRKIAEAYVRGNISKNVKPKKVIFYDVNMEYEGIKMLALKDVPRFTHHPKIEMRRIVPFNENGTVMTSNEIISALDFILENFRGGMLVVEDVKKYISHNINKDIYGKIVTTRHRAVDLVLHVQGINIIKNPGLFPNINLLRVHKYVGSVKKYKNDFDEYYPLVQIAENLVNNRYKENLGIIRQKNIVDKTEKAKLLSFYIYILIEDEVIKGEFTKEEFKEAIEKYLYQNKRDTVDELLDMRDRNTGKPLYTYKTAFDKLESDLFEQYYGNAK